jgi:tRNA(Arg) A34 adenosine deaminase TadA
MEADGGGSSGGAVAAGLPALALGPAQEAYMQQAFEQGEEALAVAEVPVGCVLVADGAVLAVGRNYVNEKKNATRHAEMEAVDRVIAAHGLEHAQELLRRTELYVTCEPCIMCASALAQLGVPRIWFGCRNDRFGGCGTVLDSYGLSLQPGGGKSPAPAAAAACWVASTAAAAAARRRQPQQSDPAAAAEAEAAAAAAREARTAAEAAGVRSGVLQSQRFSCGCGGGGCGGGGGVDDGSGGGGEILHWAADGCEFVSGFGEAEAIALLKRFYEIGNPRTAAAAAAASAPRPPPPAITGGAEGQPEEEEVMGEAGAVGAAGTAPGD